MAVATPEQVTKRLNLALPEALFNQLEVIAGREGTSVTELLRRFIKLGILAVELGDDSEYGVFVRQEGQVEKKVFLL